MAAEKTITAGALSLGNYLTKEGVRIIETNYANRSSASENSFSQQSFYPGKNLLLSQRSKRWRSSSTSLDKLTSVAFDLGQNITPEVFALIDSNLIYSGTLGATNSILPSGTVETNEVVLQGSSTSSFSSVQQFTYGFYQPDPLNGVIRFYVGNDDSGNPAGAYRYWRVIFPDKSNGGVAVSRYFEVGEIWLGPLDEIRIEHDSISISQSDLSPYSTSYSGALYFDKLKVIRSIGVSLAHVLDTSSEGVYTSSLSLQEKLSEVGFVNSVLLDIGAYNTELASDPKRKKLDVYYCKLSEASWSSSMQHRRTLSLTFEEAR